MPFVQAVINELNGVDACKGNKPCEMCPSASIATLDKHRGDDADNYSSSGFVLVPAYLE